MKKHILVVDDDESVRESLKKVLVAAGYEVVLASGGLEAAIRFEPGQVDLMLLDLNLPNQSGWDIFEGLSARYPLVPVIIITGLANQQRVAKMAGVGALFEKPVEAGALLEKMEELIAEPPEPRLQRLCGQLEETTHVGSAKGNGSEPEGDRLRIGAGKGSDAEASGRHGGGRQ